jgi:PAS domain S-box-containing protein
MRAAAAAVAVLDAGLATGYSVPEPGSGQGAYPVISLALTLGLLLLGGVSAFLFRRLRAAERKRKQCEAIISGVGPDVLLLVDSERTILMCSASMKRVFGYDLEEIIHQKTDILYADRRSKPGQKYEIYHVLELEGVHTGSATGRTKDGQLIPLEISTSLLREGGGALLLIRDISRRKRREDALRRDRDFLSRIFDMTGCFLLILDREGKVVRVNAAFERAAGRTLSEIRGTHFWDLFTDPDSVRPLKSVFEKLPASEFPISHEHEIETKEGGRRTLAWSSTLMVDSEDSTEYIVCTGIDATERARLETRLKASEGFCRAVFHADDEAIIVTDTKGGIVEATEKVIDIVRYPREQLLQMHIGELAATEDRILQTALKDVLQKGNSATVSAALVRRDGKTVHVKMAGRLVEYDGRKVIKTVITEKTGGSSRAVDAAAEDADAIAVVEHAHDLMWSLDDALRLRAANAACRDFFFYVYGIRMKPGMAVMQFLPSDVRTVLARSYNEAIKHGSARVEQHVTHGSVSFDIEIVCSAVMDDNGTISGASFVARDVSERREREDEARSALKEKETLLQEAHHRVKNNLQVVASLLSIQLDRVRDKESIEMFRESLNRVKSMWLIHETLHQTRDFSKIDFGEYVKKLANYLFRAYSVNTSRIRLRVSSGSVITEVGQAISCGLIVNELVSNALKYAFPSGAEGEVYVETRPRENGHVTLIVGDTGVGMPKEADAGQAKTLGLQLVHTLVQQIKGVVEVRRQGGTEFAITFPVQPQK